MVTLVFFGIFQCGDHPVSQPPQRRRRPLARGRGRPLKVIKACSVLDIRVHEHIIVSMLDDRYHSMADQGAIERIYREVAQ